MRKSPYIQPVQDAKTNGGTSVPTTTAPSTASSSAVTSHARSRVNRATHLIIAMVCALFLIASTTLAGCAGSSSNASSESAYQDQYDYSNLDTSTGRYQYKVDGKTVSSLGVDVSSHQDSINWSSVARDGISFAYVRLGYRGSTTGGISLDTQYQTNVSGASAAGLKVGVYFFSQATTEDEARAEAQFVLKHLSKVATSLPIAYDQEPSNNQEGSRAYNLSLEQYAANAQAFCEVIKQAGYTPMVYGNGTDLADMDIDNIKQYDIWYAQYNATAPQNKCDYTFWQYSSTGSVKGISGNVDMDIRMPNDERDNS